MLAGVEKPKKVAKKKAAKDETGEKKKKTKTTKKSKNTEGGQERNGSSTGQQGTLIDMDSWLDEKGEELQKNLIEKATQQIKVGTFMNSRNSRSSFFSDDHQPSNKIRSKIFL